MGTSRRELEDDRSFDRTCFKALPALLTEVKDNGCFTFMKSDDTRRAGPGTCTASIASKSINPGIKSSIG